MRNFCLVASSRKIVSCVVFRISVDLVPKCSTISLLGSALERLTKVFYERESGVEWCWGEKKKMTSYATLFWHANEQKRSGWKNLLITHNPPKHGLFISTHQQKSCYNMFTTSGSLNKSSHLLLYFFRNCGSVLWFHLEDTVLFITRELPAVSLMNISNGQIYVGNGNTFLLSNFLWSFAKRNLYKMLEAASL